MEKLRITSEFSKHFLFYASKHIPLRKVWEGSENAYKQNQKLDVLTLSARLSNITYHYVNKYITCSNVLGLPEQRPTGWHFNTELHSLTPWGHESQMAVWAGPPPLQGWGGSVLASLLVGARVQSSHGISWGLFCVQTPLL